ncbi:hypothetical protein [Amycolatopsis sp. NPDC004079]|uniref:hypothetical protein n=1 Tax=Amycolatopsis sp. NPDC004079 TaxID=3154549 RepID=UPI00339FF829
MSQAQTALVSAITAAFVTMVIEYLAKPQLEARKDRIVAANRERREAMAKLELLPPFYFDLVLLADLNHGSDVGITALNVARDEVDALLRSLLKFEHLLGKRQRRLAREFEKSMSSKLGRLGVIEMMHEEGYLLTSAFIFAARRALLENVSGVSDLLALRPYRPWSYFRKLRELRESLEQSDQAIDNIPALEHRRTELDRDRLGASSPDAP